MALTPVSYHDLIDVPRNVWDPTEGHHSRHGERRYSEITGVEVHWAGSPGNLADHGDTDEELLSFEAYHEVSKGWYDLFYNVACDYEGYVYEGRDITIPSQGNLTNWMTFLVVAGPSDPAPPVVVFQRIFDAWLAVSPSLDPAALRYHNERSSTTCPGPYVEDGVNLLRAGWTPYDEGTMPTIMELYKGIQGETNPETGAPYPKPPDYAVGPITRAIEQGWTNGSWQADDNLDALTTIVIIDRAVQANCDGESGEMDPVALAKAVAPHLDVKYG